MIKSSYNIPIIIFSYNRHNYLNRILKYYRKHHYEKHLIIADGSNNPWTDSMNSSVTYLHLPGLSLRDRFLEALTKTQSDLIVFCADDDFLIPSGLEVCVNFLRQNPDYSNAHGFYVRMVNRNDTLYYTQKHPGAEKIIEAYDENPLTRVNAAFFPRYLGQFYAVHRRSTIERYSLIDGLSDEEWILDGESLGTMISALEGKSRRLPVLYNIREMENVKTYNTNPNYILIAEALLKFRKISLDIFNDYNIKTDLAYETTDDITNLLLETYFLSTYSQKKPPSISPLTIRNLVSKFLARLRPYGIFKNVFGKIKKSSGENTYPFTSNRDLEEFLIIDNVIKDWEQQQYAKKIS